MVSKTRTWVPETVHGSENVAVYVTRTGRRYHRPGCRYLRHGRHLTVVSEAGRRSRCRVCQPIE
jgi:hypothetical protein